MQTPPSVCVITATAGNPSLLRCIQSVQKQTYTSVEHFVVVDGPEWNARVDAILQTIPANPNLQAVRLPFPTGKNNYRGHRIYGAMPFLLSSDFFCFLDEDNWFDPEHIATMVQAMDWANASWGFSLRKIVDEAGQLIALDQCESLGNLHPVVGMKSDHLIDTNCYLIRRDIAIQLVPVWDRAGAPGTNVPGPDRAICQSLMRHYPGGACSRKHSLNRTISDKQTGASASICLSGNQAMRKQYPQGLPWEKMAT